MSTPMRAFMTIALAVPMLLAGCGGDQQQGGRFQRPPTPVETASVEAGSVTDRFTTVGTLDAGESITVAVEIDGIVEAVPYREGGHLDRGDLIARLDDAQLAAEAARAAALEDQARATWTRVKTVVDQGAGAPQDLDDAVAALKVAEANRALAETRLAKTRITAPFAGIAGARRVSPGAFLRAGSAITDLARVDRLRVSFAVPERLLGAIHQGAPINVRTTAFPDVELAGTIDVIEPQLDAMTRNVGIVARVDNPDELLRPGMSATVSVILSNRQGALTVPSEAVFVEGGQAYVYLVKSDSLVTRRPVTLGSRQAESVEITSGLGGGQQVVRAGHQKLYEGAKVMPVRSAPQGEAPQEGAGR